MPKGLPSHVTAFEGNRRIASGPLTSVVCKVRETMVKGATGTVLIFDDRTGDQIDLDLSLPNSSEDVPDTAAPEEQAGLRRAGRPRLGVVPREVTLLPRHWEWLGRQPGGASATLRKMVEQARRQNLSQETIRAAREALYRFMTTMAGNTAGYEEALRALFKGDSLRFSMLTAEWPGDVREHVWRLAPAAFGYEPSPLDATIPFPKREAALRACQAAFGVDDIESVERITKGASGAAVFKIASKQHNYLLRVEGPSDDLRNPARQYRCLKIAAEIGVAPRLIYADPQGGVAITDFLEAESKPAERRKVEQPLQTLTRTVKTLHAAPLFPALIDYLDGVELLIRRCQGTGMLPKKVMEKLLRFIGEMISAYPRNTDDIVSSHNDLHPGNVLFQKDRAWLVDWESAFAADRYVDLAAIANFFATNEHERELMLQSYFGAELSDIHRARLFLMQQANRIFYGTVILNFVAAKNPGTRLTATALTRASSREIRGDMAQLYASEDKTHLACLFLRDALSGFESSRFPIAIALIKNHRNSRANTQI